MLTLDRQHPAFSLPLELLCLLPCEPEHSYIDGDGPGALREHLVRDLELPNQCQLSGLVSLLWERYQFAPTGFNMVVDDHRGQAKRRALRIRRGDWERAQELCDDYLMAVYGKRREF